MTSEKGREHYLILPCSDTLTYPCTHTHTHVIHSSWILCTLGAAISHFILYVWKIWDWSPSVVYFSLYPSLPICHFQTRSMCVCVPVHSWTDEGWFADAALLSWDVHWSERTADSHLLSCLFPAGRLVWGHKLPEDEPRIKKKTGWRLEQKESS